jgi:hypothetical protein
MTIESERRRQRKAKKYGAHIRSDFKQKPPYARLSDEDIEDILFKHERGISAAELGTIYGVNRNYIYMLKSRIKKQNQNQNQSKCN